MDDILRHFFWPPPCFLLWPRSAAPSAITTASTTPYYSDYHDWDDHERVYYQQWVVETHRDTHRDFRKLDKDDQRQYWTWRHSRPDRDRDHDRDHDKH